MAKKQTSKQSKPAAKSGSKSSKPARGVKPMSPERLARLNKERANQGLPPLEGDVKMVIHKGDPAELPITIEPSARTINQIFAEDIIFKSDGTGVEIRKGAKLSEGDYVATISFIAKTQENAAFILGDLLVAAEKDYGKTYEAIIKATGYDAKTLRNYKSVCANLSPDRRQPGLNYGVQATVAYLPAGQQSKLLEKAAKQGLSVKAMREEVKKIQPPEKKDKKGKGKAGAATPTAGAAGTGAEGVTFTEIPLNESEEAENEAAAQKCDEVVTFLRGKLFAKLPASKKNEWKQLLKHCAEAYEALVDEK